MHPILRERTRLLLYLGAWLPLAGLFAALLVLSAGSGWAEVAVLTPPLVVVYAFLCLTAWYPCRALPLQQTGLVRAIGIHLGTATVSSALWVVLALGLSRLLGEIPLFAGVPERVRGLAVLLLATGVLLYLLSVVVHYLVVAFETSRQAEARALRAELAAREAELHALRTQLDPHFIFNSLNSISSLVGSDVRAARQMCEQLGEFLRDSLRLGRQVTIPLAEELRLITQYLAVEQVRYGSRLQIEQEVVTGIGSCQVPPLLLQPLVENALKHGISQLVDARENLRAGFLVENNLFRHNTFLL